MSEAPLLPAPVGEQKQTNIEAPPRTADRHLRALPDLPQGENVLTDYPPLNNESLLLQASELKIPQGFDTAGLVQLYDAVKDAKVYLEDMIQMGVASVGARHNLIKALETYERTADELAARVDVHELMMNDTPASNVVRPPGTSWYERTSNEDGVKVSAETVVQPEDTHVTYTLASTKNKEGTVDQAVRVHRKRFNSETKTYVTDTHEINHPMAARKVLEMAMRRNGR